MYTMLQAPSIGGVRRFGAVRKAGHGVCRRKAVLVGFRAQSGMCICNPLLLGTSSRLDLATCVLNVIETVDRRMLQVENAEFSIYVI